MTFVTKQNAGLLKSVRSWGVLGLLLVLAVFVLVQNAQTQVGTDGIIPPGGYVAASEPGGARILGDQGNLPTNPAIGFFSTCPSPPTVRCNDGGGGNGIFRPLANVMAFATSSQERMRIGPGGWVAIGATAPSAGALLTVNGHIHAAGNITGAAKMFVQAHPLDQTKEIVYVSLEGPEAGTYIRGTAQLTNGEAVIELPEHFSLVTNDQGLTVQLTPFGELLQLYVVEKSAKRIVVREANGKSGQFDYLVQGVRKGYENHQVIRDK